MTVYRFSCKFSKYMDGKKKRKSKRPVFDSIRKPTAPPSQKFGRAKPDEKANPARRKSKHKSKDETNSENEIL